MLPAESYSAVLSFYETIAAFEAARSGTAVCHSVVSCATSLFRLALHFFTNPVSSVMVLH